MQTNDGAVQMADRWRWSISHHARHAATAAWWTLVANFARLMIFWMRGCMVRSQREQREDTQEGYF